MKPLACSACANPVFFESLTCLQCNRSLGFDARRIAMVALERASNGPRRAADFAVARQEIPRLLRRRRAAPERVRYCANHANGCCNWIVPSGDALDVCPSCAMNRSVPNLAEPGNAAAWAEFEAAKKRLIYSLLRFGLPSDGAAYGAGQLRFDFGHDLVTGHLDGLITVNLLEANSVERERLRQQFSELHRSLLGHLRHESGHFYWLLLIDSRGRHDAFRALFGDERDDYSAALARYHDKAAMAAWGTDHISAYATAHPWEDWAETWAHYLHMVDALETAEGQGMEPLSRGRRWPIAGREKGSDIYREVPFKELIARWIPLTVRVNCLSRSIGQPDFYPFLVTERVASKLAFVHDAIRGADGCRPSAAV